MAKKSVQVDDYFECDLVPNGEIKSQGRTAVGMVKGFTSCDRAVALIMIEYTFQDIFAKSPKSGWRLR